MKEWIRQWRQWRVERLARLIHECETIAGIQWPHDDSLSQDAAAAAKRLTKRRERLIRKLAATT
jgi:hypothetical protein